MFAFLQTTTMVDFSELGSTLGTPVLNTSRPGCFGNASSLCAVQAFIEEDEALTRSLPPNPFSGLTERELLEYKNTVERRQQGHEGTPPTSTTHVLHTTTTSPSHILYTTTTTTTSTHILHTTTTTSRLLHTTTYTATTTYSTTTPTTYNTSTTTTSQYGIPQVPFQPTLPPPPPPVLHSLVLP